MLMRRTMTVLTVMAAAATVVGGGLVAGPVAWASTGHVHPGSVVTVSSNTCEVGFLLRQRHTVYASVPASCLGTDGGGGGSGCMESQSPNGTPATIAGASRKAHLVYSSFTRMQERGTTSAHTCAGNNLALLQLSSRDARRARGEIPGPASLTGVAHSPPASGTTLRLYLSSPSSGRAGGTSEGGWLQEVTVSGMVAASNLGAPTVTSRGRAVGMLASVPPLTGVGASQVSSLAKDLHFLRTVRRFRGVRLMTR